jgi:hypothetical protein
MLFDRYGLLYERKRGEFGDGLSKGYIEQNQIIERNLFFRIYYVSNGLINKAFEKKLFFKSAFNEQKLANTVELDNFYFGYLCYRELNIREGVIHRKDRSKYALIYAFTKKHKPQKTEDYESTLALKLPSFLLDWNEFVNKHTLNDTRFLRTYIDKDTLAPRQSFSTTKWFRSHLFEEDVKNYFG